jgi:hypothetical protein
MNKCSDEQVLRPAQVRDFPQSLVTGRKCYQPARDSALDRSHSSSAEAIRDNKVADLDSYSLGRTSTRERPILSVALCNANAIGRICIL